MKPIFFTKMEGTGNDFLIIDNRTGFVNETICSDNFTEFVKKLSDRHLGAGSDGVIFLEQSTDFPFSMRYYNQDGSEAAACFNGARCVVSYAFRFGLVRDKGKFMSEAGPVGFYNKNGTVSIEVMPPVDLKLNFSLTVNRKKYRAHFLRVGVPHCVIFVDSYDKIDIVEIGRAIRNHKKFKPEGTNVNFVKTEENHIFVRSYERGVETETLSCGSGVLAAAYIATKLFITQSPVICKTNGGDLLISIKDKLYIEGTTNYIYDGVYYLQ